MKYSVNFYLKDKSTLPLCGRSDMTVSESVFYISNVLKRQLYTRKKFVCIHISEENFVSDERKKDSRSLF